MDFDWVPFFAGFLSGAIVSLLRWWIERRAARLDRQYRFEFSWRGNKMTSNQPFSLRDIQIFVNVLKELEDAKQRKDQPDDRGGEDQAG